MSERLKFEGGTEYAVVVGGVRLRPGDFLVRRSDPPVPVAEGGVAVADSVFDEMSCRGDFTLEAAEEVSGKPAEEVTDG